MQEYQVKVHRLRTEWYQDGLLHREGGPAVEWTDGHKVWYKNGLRHRDGGPAIETVMGTKAWFVIGRYYTEETFNRYIGKTKNLTSAEIEEYFNTYWKNATLEFTFIKNNKELCHDKIIIEMNGQKLQITPIEKT